MKKVLAFFNNRSSYVAVSLFFLMCVQILGSAHANAADSQLRAEIGSNLSYVILQNSQIYVKYLPFNEGHTQFAIREFRIKSAGNENQAGDISKALPAKRIWQALPSSITAPPKKPFGLSGIPGLSLLKLSIQAKSSPRKFPSSQIANTLRSSL